MIGRCTNGSFILQGEHDFSQIVESWMAHGAIESNLTWLQTPGERIPLCSQEYRWTLVPHQEKSKYTIDYKFYFGWRARELKQVFLDITKWETNTKIQHTSDCDFVEPSAPCYHLWHCILRYSSLSTSMIYYDMDTCLICIYARLVVR